MRSLREFAARLSAGRHRAHRERAAVLRFSVRALARDAPGAAISARCRGLRIRNCEGPRRHRGVACWAGWRQAPRRWRYPPTSGSRSSSLRLRYPPDFRRRLRRKRPRSSAIRRSRSPCRPMPRIRGSSRCSPLVFDVLADAGRLDRSIRRSVQRRRSTSSSRACANMGSSRCARENLHHRQVSAHTGRCQHADLLERARSCRARPRGSCRDQRQGGGRAIPHAHAARRTGSDARRRTMAVR